MKSINLDCAGMGCSVVEISAVEIGVFVAIELECTSCILVEKVHPDVRLDVCFILCNDRV